MLPAACLVRFAVICNVYFQERPGNRWKYCQSRQLDKTANIF